MSTNNKLPLGYTIRVARSYDISKINILMTEEALKGGIKILITISFFLCIFMFFIGVWDISSIIIFLTSTVLIFGTTSFILYITNYLIWIQILNKKECLIICFRNKVCGFIIASEYHKYSYIKLLFIASSYRRKGLAKYLMQNAFYHLKYPIYLISMPKNYLFKFYTSLGFTFIKNNQLPKELKKHTSSFVRMFPMVIEEN
ncbi:MAG: GNAT family N-acetyltransferase [Cyanobacteriota bacterium]|nr:GNAT family N-acetyltransferase [Cyanobacteriota bacterium]